MKFKILNLLLCTALLSLYGCPGKDDKCETFNDTYTSYVKGVMDSSCAISGCHVAGGTAPTNYTTYAGVKAVVDNGQFKNRALNLKDMPPIAQPDLTTEQLDRLECWVNSGAPQ